MKREHITSSCQSFMISLDVSNGLEDDYRERVCHVHYQTMTTDRCSFVSIDHRHDGGRVVRPGLGAGQLVRPRSTAPQHRS